MTKSDILEKTNGGETVFKYYLPEYDGTPKAFLSPIRDEKNPSASIFRAASGQYLFKDFGTGEALNCFDFIMLKYSLLNFRDAIKMITKDLKLNKQMEIMIDQSNKIDIHEKDKIVYFDDYCPSELIGKYIEKYELYRVSGYTSNGARFEAKDGSQMLAYKIGEKCYKVTTFSKDEGSKYTWIGAGNKPSGYQNVWGIPQLPDTCDTILITEGLKDAFVANVNLNHRNIYAVGVDSVTTAIPDTIIKELRSKCQNLVVCYDNDTAGVGGANRVAKRHNLKVCTLPDDLKTSGGKDISDWFKAKLDESQLIDAIGNAQFIKEETDDSEIDEELRKILETERKLLEYCSSPVKPEPLILRGESPVIIKGTLNAIAGREGSHKSHLAESIASLLLSVQTESDSDMGFRRNNNEPYMVLYVDTERNTQSELPEAMRNIGNRSIMTNGSEFHPFTLKEYSRGNRLATLKRYLEHKRLTTDKHMIVFLDVITDCVGDFNDEKETLNLFDLLGSIAEDNNATFIVVIHLNPNGLKARGHVGSELENKASTSIHISHKEGTITLDFKKTRHSKPLPKALLRFDERTAGLVKLSKEETAKYHKSKEHERESLIKAIEEVMPEVDTPYTQKDVLLQLKTKLGLSDNTIKKRLKELSDEEIELDGFTKLEIVEVKGKPTQYQRISKPVE